MIAHTSQHLMPNWLHLSDVVASGKPATAVNEEGDGSAFFQELVSNIFPMSYGPAQALAKHLALGESGPPVRVLDLGAGSGVWGIAVAQSSPRVSVTAVDWPGVLPIAQKTAARFGLADRYTGVPGDLLSADFGRDHNVITIGHILHSEGVERSKQASAQMLRRARIRRHDRHRRVPRQPGTHRASDGTHLRRQHAREHGAGRHVEL